MRLMRFCLLCVCLFICVKSNAQFSLSTILPDTLKADYRTGGDLDSIDLFTGFLSSTLPGGGWNLTGNNLEPLDLIKFQGGQRFYNFNNWKKIRFTGLPHLGFAYSFGSKGSQFIQAEYQQVFKSNTILNIDYITNTSNGFLRRGNFSHNDFQFQLVKPGKKYSFELKGSYESSDVSMNGGLLIDTLANDFPLIFLPVHKENAQLKTSRIRLHQSNYLDFNSDSINALGLFTQHELKIKKHLYSEEDTLFGIYDLINFDSIRTYDQHQWSQVSSGIGVFFKNQNHFFKSGVDFKFWNFQNLGNYRDTIEVSIVGSYHYNSKKLLIADQFESNVIGAQREITNYFNFTYIGGKIKYHGQFLLENKLPDYHQRYAIGNNYNAPSDVLEKQLRIMPQIGASGWVRDQGVSGSYNYTYLKDNYFFIKDKWRNDTLNSINFHQIKIRLDLIFSSFHIQPNYIYTTSGNNFEIIPSHQLQTRIFVEGGLFKAKKMLAYIGVDVAYQSAYQKFGFASNVSSFQFDATENYNTSLFNLHFFTGFQIEEFKFFVRYENIAYFWTDHNQEVVNKYPIPSTFLKLGLSWDFFN